MTGLLRASSGSRDRCGKDMKSTRLETTLETTKNGSSQGWFVTHPPSMEGESAATRHAESLLVAIIRLHQTAVSE